MLNRSILVSGGAGFIGSHVVRSLLELDNFKDYPILVLDDLSGGFQDNLPRSPRLQLVVGSVTDTRLVKKLFSENGFCYVYHLAAYAAEGLSHFIRRFNYTNNLIGSVNLVNASINYGVECFVFTSSIAVYGRAQVPMNERMMPVPEDPYGIAKLAVELDLKAAHELFGIDFVTFRPHNVYGEYQNIGDRYRNVVGIFMTQILQNKPMTVFGDGNQQRAFSYIGDVAPIIAKAPLVEKARNRVFNIGADQPYTVNELANQVALAMDVEPQFVHLPPRNEVYIAFSDHSECRETFGTFKETRLEEGLRKMADWVRSVGVRKSKKFEEIEVPKNLPPVWGLE